MKDLTEGKVSKVLWQFSMPMFISVIFQQLYNIADSVIVGKFSGEDSLAAVGASYPITMIYMAIAIGSNAGCSVVISHLFGAKKYERMKTAVSTTILASFTLAVLLSILGIAGNRFLMQMIQTPKNIFDDGALYLKIYIAGFLFLFLYNIATGIFSALGDSKTPLYFLIASSLGNVALDYIFVVFFHWGVAGVAWATFIAQSIACILALVTLFAKLSVIKTQGKVAFFSVDVLGDVAKMAIPSILQQSFVSIGNIFIQSIINSYGSGVIAGYSAAIKLNTFMLTSFTTLANGISNFTAQNMGAGKTKRIKQGYSAALLMSLMIAVPIFLTYFFAGDKLITLFLKEKTITTVAVGVQFLKIISPFYLVISIKLMADGVLRGAQKVGCFMISTFSDLILRVVLAYILSPKFGTTGVWMSWPIGWIASVIISYAFYYKLQKKLSTNTYS